MQSPLYSMGNAIETDRESVSIRSARQMGNRAPICLFLAGPDLMAAGVILHTLEDTGGGP